MATEKPETCGACNQNEAARHCDVCEIPICEMCTKTVYLEEQSPAAQAGRGAPPISPLRAGSYNKKVCPKCFVEADFF